MGQRRLLLEKIRSATAVEHHSVEQTLDALHPGWSLVEYYKLLECFFDFYQRWEADAVAHAPIELREFIRCRLKLPAIAKDLSYLADELRPECNRSDVDDLIASRDEASIGLTLRQEYFLGSMYVIEGSTLGGQLLAKHFRECLDLSPGHGLDFFTGYGPQTGQRWKEFLELLDRYDERVDHQAVVDAALDTFHAIGNRLRSWRMQCPVS